MSDDALGVGHRLSSGPSSSLAATAFAHELEAAPYLWRGMAMADLAHAIALHEAGLVPDDSIGALLGGLLSTAELTPDALDPHVGDVYNNRDRLLQEVIGAEAGFLHTGRARREASTIAWQLMCRDQLLQLGESTVRLAGEMISTAERHADTLMPDYTYLHRAHPTTLGHYLLGHAEPLVRHLDRVRQAVRTVDSSPAGSASTNGSSLSIDRELLRTLLGFETVLVHNRDAMWAPDMALDIVHVVLQVMTSLDRFAEDLQLWTTEAFGFAELADRHSRTSVVMPHKKNPYALTYLRGAARHALGVQTGVAASLLTPSGQPDNRTIAYLDVPRELSRCVGAVDLASEVVAETDFDTPEMQRAALDGFTTSTEICDRLVQLGATDNRTAHRLVGRAVRLAVDADRTTLSFDDVAAAAQEMSLELPIGADELTDLVDAARTVARRVTPGGASPDAIAEMIAADRRRLDETAAWFRGHPSRGYEERLESRARALHQSASPASEGTNE